MPDKLIFSQTFEGLFRATAAHLDEPTVAALKAAGIDPQAELKPSYPLPVFHAVVKLLAQRLFPEAGPEEQLRRLGTVGRNRNRFARDGQGFIGQTLLQVSHGERQSRR